MAFVESLWSVTFTFVDNNEETATMSVNYAGGLLQETVELAAENLAAPLQALSDAKLARYAITKQFVNDDLTAPPATSEVERKLRITLSTATRRGAASVEIPSPKFEIEQVGTNAVDPAQALVAPVIAQLTSGLLLPGNGPVTWFGADIVAGVEPVIIHRNRKAKE